ncbi:MAG: hypothetical protein J0H48_12580 [Nitrosospira multiformis]|nr:hypothetical protein [Nitrosospira multiformis]
MADIALCLVITKTLLGAWALLSAAEWLANLHLFRSNGLLTRSILRLRPRLVIPASIRHHMHAESTVIAVLICRIVAGLFLLIPYPNPADLPCSLLILLSCFYMSRRTWFGGDGSDQMGMVVAAGVAIISAGLVLDDMNVTASGVLAISGQAVLAYFVAGAAKVASPVWREGNALPGVMKTRTYGHPFAASFAAERPAFCKFVCWLTIGTEMLFPLVLLAPPGLAIASLCCFALFHFSNAYFMGLNAFVWPFLATYPAVMLANSAVRNWIGWI